MRRYFPLLVVTMAACASLKGDIQRDVHAPVAALSAPGKRVEVFRLTDAEKTGPSYMVVRVNENGTATGYGDEQTVGLVVESLNAEFRNRPAHSGRCPAAAGWRYDSPTVRATFCSPGIQTTHIERAITLLEAASRE
jgi:hypothetical protein